MASSGAVVSSTGDTAEGKLRDGDRRLVHDDDAPLNGMTQAFNTSDEEFGMVFGWAAGETASVTWTLTDKNGNVINSRSAVAISPASSVNIVLGGDDLALQPGESGDTERHLTVAGTYYSNTGSDLPLKSACKFVIEDLAGVS